MKARVTFSLDQSTVEYLTSHAKVETGGNVSAYLDKLARRAALAEALDQHAAWYSAHPGYAEGAEAERHAAGAE